MTDDRFPSAPLRTGPETIQFDELKAHKLFLSAGTAYGMIFGLGFALLAWGYDALLLASSSVDLAWMKLLLGLPLAIIIGSLSRYRFQSPRDPKGLKTGLFRRICAR